MNTGWIICLCDYLRMDCVFFRKKMRIGVLNIVLSWEKEKLEKGEIIVYFSRVD